MRDSPLVRVLNVPDPSPCKVEPWQGIFLLGRGFPMPRRVLAPRALNSDKRPGQDFVSAAPIGYDVLPVRTSIQEKG